MKKILIGVGVLGGLVGVFALVVAFQPSEYRVARSALLPAPPAAVFPQIDDLRNWNAWSPWAKRDPDVKNTFEGPSSGKGAIFRWSGNREVGKGVMTIVESRPSELIRLRLDFIDPFPGTSDTEFTFAPEGTGTKATWTMSGRHDFVGKAVCLFMDMDKMIGGDFEAGFENLKGVLESGKKK